MFSDQGQGGTRFPQNKQYGTRGGYQGNQGRFNNNNTRDTFQTQETNGGGGDNRNVNGNWNNPNQQPQTNGFNGPKQFNQGQTNPQNTNFPGGRGPQNYNNNNKDGFPQNSNNNRKKVLTVINKITINENFSSCFLLPPDNNQNQQTGVVNRNEKVQIVLSSQEKYQNYLAIKQEQGIQLLGSPVLSSEKQHLKIEGCFVIKNPINKNQELSVLSIQDSLSNLYGIQIISSSATEPHFLKDQGHYQVAHKGPILQVLSFENWIVTVADNDDISVKFWNLGQYNIQIDENITSGFNKNFTAALIENSIQPTPIKCIQFVQSNGTIIILVSFKFVNMNQSQNQNGTTPPSQNSLYCFTMDQQLKVMLYKKIDVGLTTCSITQIKPIFLNDAFYVFVMQTNFTQRDNNQMQGNNSQPPKGFIQLIKSLQTVFEVYQSGYPINDFVVVPSKEMPCTIIVAGRSNIQPITWIPQTDELKLHQSDSFTMKDCGDIQKIHLFKNVINLVEINQLLVIHYPNDRNSGSTHKSITLSSLQIMENKPNNFASQYQDAENPNPFAQNGNNSGNGGQGYQSNYKGNKPFHQRKQY